MRGGVSCLPHGGSERYGRFNDLYVDELDSPWNATVMIVRFTNQPASSKVSIKVGYLIR